MTASLRRAWRAVLHPPVDPAELLDDAREAATVRAHQTDPDVIALAVARARDAIDRLMWLGIAAGLLYTASSVQQWGATGTPAYGQAWWTAWLLTVPIEVPLVAILRGEQMAARHGVTLSWWPRAARLGLLALMAGLNLWGPVTAALAGTGPWGQVFAHAAVPAAVVLASEAITGLRDALGHAIASAARSANARAGRRTTRSGSHRSPDDMPRGEPADRTGGADEETPGIGPAAANKRETGVAYVLAEAWPDDAPEPPMPAAIRAGLAARGVDVSRGEASRIRTAAMNRRAEASA